MKKATWTTGNSRDQGRWKGERGVSFSSRGKGTDWSRYYVGYDAGIWPRLSMKCLTYFVIFQRISIYLGMTRMIFSLTQSSYTAPAGLAGLDDSIEPSICSKETSAEWVDCSKLLLSLSTIDVWSNWSRIRSSWNKTIILDTSADAKNLARMTIVSWKPTNISEDNINVPSIVWTTARHEAQTCHIMTGIDGSSPRTRVWICM